MHSERAVVGVGEVISAALRDYSASLQDDPVVDMRAQGCGGGLGDEHDRIGRRSADDCGRDPV